MKRMTLALAALWALAILIVAQAAGCKQLFEEVPPPPRLPVRIYSIDVEGGQATLIVAPFGDTMLVDSGWPGFKGRDAIRIAAAVKWAHTNRIDLLITTHYHRDHVGGVAELAKRVPIKTFIDHGPSMETTDEAKQLYAAYESVASKGKRITVKPGDTIPLDGVKVRILTSNGEHIAAPLPGAGQPNPACAGVKPQGADSSENARSVGFLFTFGKFRFLDLGDLTWDKELELMCRANLVGTVDVFLVSHHGMNISNSPALVWAVRPRVAIMNNGAQKGGSPEAWSIIEKSPGLEDLWQLHFSLAGGPDHNVAEQFIANPGGNDAGSSIDVVAWPDGSFRVTNGRTGYTKNYPAH